MALDEESGIGGYYLENAMKAFAALAAGVYVIGYVVTENYLAKYGVTEFRIFKPRMLAAGLLTSCLLAFVVLPPYVFLPVKRVSLPFYAVRKDIGERALRCASFQIGVFSALAYMLSSQQNRTGSVCLIGLATVSYYSNLVVAKKQASGGRLTKRNVVVLATVVIGLLTILHLRSAVSFKFVFTLCFAAVVIGTPLALSRTRNFAAKAIAYTLGILVSVCGVFPFYMSDIFAEVRPSWGGGAPVRIVLSIEKQSGMLVPCSTREMQLIDENDSGYYVSLRRDLVKTYDAFFVPKENVSGIFFSLEISRE